MIVVVAYDISKEEVRGRLRRYLGRLGLSIINRSVYAGVGGEKTAKRIAEKASKIIEENDNVFIITIPEQFYDRAYIVTSGNIKRIKDTKYEIL